MPVRYGIPWSANTNPLAVEIKFIRAGGYITHNGQRHGEGLFHHYREFQKLCWPEGEDHHRWSDLMLREILANRITAISGARDSGKTHVALSRFGLTDYFCFPDETLILISSTDLRGLQLRVWGDIKDMLSKAKDRHPWLPGNVVESLHGVFTDKLSEDTPIRDIRKGIICFLTGTMVDTPYGPRAIESLRAGDEVFNAIGTGMVTEAHQSVSPELVRITLSGGIEIECTPEHPFFTWEGWKKAIDLTKFDRVLSAYETMRLLQGSSRARVPQSEVLFRPLQGTRTFKEMQDVRIGIPALETGEWSFLQYCVCGPMGFKDSSKSETGEVSHLRQGDGRPLQPEVLFSDVPRSANHNAVQGLREAIRFDAAFAVAQKIKVLQSILQKEITWPFQLQEEIFANAGRNGGLEIVPGCNYALPPSDWIENEEREGAMVRARHSISKDQVGGGNRRGGSQHSPECITRRLENEYSKGAWVDRVEVLKPESDKRFDRSAGGYRVHNLSVEGHPSYSVGGVIVHNCIPCLDRKGTWVGGLEKFVGIKQKRRRVLGDEVQFMHAEYLTVLSNLDKGDFKGVFVGNALANFRALDKISEPLEGWGNHHDPTKTEVFPNRYGGNTITLVGTDSPNYDQPEGVPDKYPYLVSRTDEKSVGDRYGRNSEQYYSQIAGYRKPGLFAHRVLTQEMCERYHAFKEVVWQGEETTKVYACDMGFGGDRAVAGWGEFGREVNGNIVVRVQPPGIIPISVDTEPEDQIALYVRKECGALGIAGANVFYDAGMRATAAVAMSKLFSPEANAVNFGGSPTKRPVSGDEYVIDRQTGAKRLKRCDEHYIKFVTEMWFSVRLTVMSRQMRELPRDVAEEFYLREWTLEKGDRYELEKKEDTKDRTGVSPDLGDWLAILIEGARRLEFMIESLPEYQGQTSKDDDYLQKELEKYQRERRKRQLNYT